MTQIPAPVCQYDDGLFAYTWNVNIPMCELPVKWAQRDVPARIAPELFAYAHAEAVAQAASQSIAQAAATGGGFTFTGWTGGGGHCCTTPPPEAPPSPVPLPAGGVLLALALAALVLARRVV